MINLIRMDLYRMRRSKSWLVCLILAALCALAVTPTQWLLTLLANTLTTAERTVFPATAELADFIANPFPFINAMLALIAAGSFFYADLEYGYIKNIAGQMPKKGYTILSKFIAVMVLNLVFMVVGVAFNLLGTIMFQSIVTNDDVLQGVLTFLVKFVLVQACCAVLLLFLTGFRSKSLGSVMAVLMGTGMLSLVYMGIDAGLNRIFQNKSFSVADYMPDQLLTAASPDLLIGLIAGAVTIAIFLPITIKVFDRRDIK